MHERNKLYTHVTSLSTYLAFFSIFKLSATPFGQMMNVHISHFLEKEADKVALADSTGLDQKQINNWFINQRKRHWKPSENMQFDAMENLYGTLFTNKEGGIS